MKFSGSRRCAKPPGRYLQAADSVVDKAARLEKKEYSRPTIKSKKER
jgi:hypothetical protein